jgi:general secretion pathway protein D
MLRLALISVTLALAGCASHDGPPSRFRDPMPDWQVRNIAGQHESAPAAAMSGETDGPVGVVQGTRGKPATIYAGGGTIAAPHPGVTYVSTGDITLDFQDVDAKEAAKAILDDVLKQTYVIDPKVEGKVTFRSGRPIAARDALRLLETSLQQVGAVLVVRGGVHYVLPKGKGLPEGPNAIQPSGGPAVAGFSSRAVQLKYIAAAEMAEILKPVIKDGGLVRVDAARNLLVLAGTGADHDAWLDTIRTFDVDFLANRSVGVFKIASMPAETMTRSLNEILRNENVDQQLVRFIPIDAGNSVLAVAKTPETLKAVRQWVQRLEAAGGQRLQLFHYQMKYAQAAQVLPIISKIFGVTAASEGEISSLTGKAGLTSKTATAPRTPSTGTAATSAQNSAQAQAAAGAAAQVAALAQSVTGAKTIAAGGAAGAGSASTEGQLPNAMRLMANEPTNTLLIYATEQDFEKVRNVLRTIDVPPRQVLVEATIVEVSLTDDLRYGVQYYLQSQIKGLPIEVALTNGKSNMIAPEVPGFGLSLASPAKAVIDALNDVTQINVVSTPNVMVLNNHVARLVVGDQVPIATQSSQDPLQGNQVVVNTIELRDTGVIFEVTPRINSSGSVLLDITQEVSTVKQQANASLTPTISQRKLSSSVTVENGETIVLGGLFSNQGTVGRAGLPGLSQLPVLGAAFGRSSDVTQRTELIVLISPKIINDKFEARHATNEMRRRIQELRFEDAKVTEKPLLPPDVVIETPAVAVDVMPLSPAPSATGCTSPCPPPTTSSVSPAPAAAPPKPKPAARSRPQPPAAAPEYGQSLRRGLMD